MRDLRHFLERVDSGPEQALAEADATDLRLRIIRLRGERQSHFARAVLGALPLAMLVAPWAQQAPVFLLMVAPGVYALLEGWRGLRAHRDLRHARDLEKRSNVDSSHA